MSLVCCGAHIVINDDIIGSSNEYHDRIRDAIWAKPLFHCCRCMASVWGGSCYIVLQGLDWNIIPAVLACAFLNSYFILKYYHS